MALRWLCFALPLVLAVQAGARAQTTPAPAHGETSMRLAELAARDARLSFTPEAARRARTALEGAGGSSREEMEARAVAVIALGCGGGSGDAARIESLLENGTLPERHVALLALGELAQAGWPALERALARDTTGIGETLCVSLAIAAHGGATVAEERLRTLAAATGDTLSRSATLALAWGTGGTAPGMAEGLADTLRLYYELRWRAARAYGFVDGMRGSQARRAELFQDEEFLDRVVFEAATGLPVLPLKAHLTEILSTSESIAALQVAALLMSDELERAIKAGAWEPSPAAWQALLAEIDEQRAERRAKKLLAVAFQTAPAAEALAGRLLFRGGGDIPWSWVSAQLEQGDAETRTRLVEACGERGEKELVPDLTEVLAQAGPELFGTALVALVRLGHEPAKKQLEELLDAPATPESEQILTALARVLHDRDLRRYAEQALRRTDLSPELRLDLQIGVVRNGVPIDREELRAALEKPMKHERRLECVRALATAPEIPDLEALDALFPVEEDLELNVELALALLRQRQPGTAGLIWAALWGDSWNRSVLAGGLIVWKGGTRGLLDEIDSAPRTATERDLRRVGFALGEWAGIGIVETLSRTRTEVDPVLQGALLGALAGRSEGDAELATPVPKVDADFTGDLGAEGDKGGAKGGAKAGGKKKPGRRGG